MRFEMFNVKIELKLEVKDIAVKIMIRLRFKFSKNYAMHGVCNAKYMILLHSWLSTKIQEYLFKKIIV